MSGVYPTSEGHTPLTQTGNIEHLPGSTSLQPVHSSLRLGSQLYLPCDYWKQEMLCQGSFLIVRHISIWTVSSFYCSSSPMFAH